ncbi:MAG: undecaprenyl-phosphate galactose phosphotransferase WbaP [Spirochaetaceae bacterium]|nr:undecaprenyl-phosphate galactose phosphotransferase WbaP [Spirochaetaceae bacterium]
MIFEEYRDWYRKRYRRTSSALTTCFLVAADLTTVMLCFGVGFFLVNLYDSQLITFRGFIHYWPYLPIFVIAFAVEDLYPGASLAPAEELRRFAGCSFIGHIFIILSRFVYYLRFDSISLAFIISYLISTVCLLMGRSLMRSFLSVTKLGGIPAVIYGAGYTGRAVVDRLLTNKHTCYVPVLILDDDPQTGNEYREVPILHDTGLGPELVKRFNIKMAIVAMPSISQLLLKKLINNSVSAFRYNVLIPDIFSVTNIWMSVRDFGGILGFATTRRLTMSWNRWIKRFMDVSIIIAGALLISPLLLGIAALVKASSPGPVLYSQERIGRNGKRFRAYKFRSMVSGAEGKLKELLASDAEARKEWEAAHKLKNDPRITAIGKFLRKTSLDEIPQFINILKGEMSLIGPRPIVEGEIKRYGANFQRIFSVRPGLTGLWQVSGRSDTDYSDRISFDTYYLQSWSVWLDLWIIYKTIGVVVRGRGAY